MLLKLSATDNSRCSILVTGGAGFIGSHTVDRLLAEGHRVRVIDNLSTGRIANLPIHHPGLEFIEGDVSDIELLTVAMRGVDRCLHLAAQVSVERSITDPAHSAEQNILGGIHVLQAARMRHLSRLVYSSSASVYGNPNQILLDETVPGQPLSPYGIEKQVLEQYASYYNRTLGLSCLGLRYFNVYGPRQDGASSYSGVIARFIDALLTGCRPRVLGDGRQQRDFIYVQDVVDANIAALFADCEGVCNVATGHSTSLMDLLVTLETLIGRCIRPQFGPARQGDIRSSLGHVGRLHDWLHITARWSLQDGLRELLEYRESALRQACEA